MEMFIGEIRLMSFNFSPKYWAVCAGRLLPINTNQALFSLLGTTYGGNGTTTFAVPDLRGRAANSLGAGTGLSNYVQGQTGGTEAVTLSIGQMPAHNHLVSASSAAASAGTAGSQPSPSNTLAQAYLTASGNQVPVNRYAPVANTTMAANVLETSGGSQPHTNMQPFLAMTYCIAISGIAPSRN